MPTSGVQFASTFDSSPLQPILSNFVRRYGFADEVKLTQASELNQYMVAPPSDSENVIGTIVAVRLEDWLRDSTHQRRTLTDVTARQVLRSHLDEFLSQLAVLALRGRPVWVMICPSTGWVAEHYQLTTLCRTMTNLFAMRVRNLSQLTVLNWPASLSTGEFNDRGADEATRIPFTLSAWEQLAESLASQISNWLENQNPDASRTHFQGSAELAAFLQGLQMQVELIAAQPNDLPHVDRILRTAASFSLTGEKPMILESEVQAIVSSGNCYLVQVSDRLSDYGRSGVIVASPVAGSLVVDLFSLSCTVLGKQVEHALLAGLAQVASYNDLRRIAFEYQPSGRNQPTLLFLESVSLSETENRFQVATADVEERIRQAAVAPGAWSLKVSSGRN
jgi:hypothetical protein